MYRRLLPFCLLGLLCLGGCGYKWQDFKAPDGSYSCSLPGSPKSESRSQATPAGVLTLTAQVVDVKNAAFLVGYFQLPPGGTFDYDAGINGVLRNAGGTLTYKKEVTVDGQKGYEFEATITKPRNGYLACRIFRHKDRLYELLVIGASTKASSKDVQKFWDSFKLLNK
jgi:hypothetical protein